MPTDKNSQRFAERDTAAFEFLPPRKRLSQGEANTDQDEDKDDPDNPDTRMAVA